LASAVDFRISGSPLVLGWVRIAPSSTLCNPNTAQPLRLSNIHWTTNPACLGADSTPTSAGWMTAKGAFGSL
jgi:hypothetical protein